MDSFIGKFESFGCMTDQFLRSVRDGVMSPPKPPPRRPNWILEKKSSFPSEKSKYNIIYIYIIKKHVNSPNYLQVYTPPTILIWVNSSSIFLWNASL